MPAFPAAVKLPGIQMLLGRALLLLHTTLNEEATFLQTYGQFILQLLERGLGVNVLGAQAAILRDGHMEKVHMRRFLVHVNHCRDDIFLSDKLGEISGCLLKKALGLVGVELVKKLPVRAYDKAAHMHRVLTHRLDHEQVVMTLPHSRYQG